MSAPLILYIEDNIEGRELVKPVLEMASFILALSSNV
jgi:hypothetical protein